MADANGYAAGLRAWQIATQAKTRAVFADMAAAVHESIVDGSPVTGAPGQPVDTSNLKTSWQLDFAPDMRSATIGTNVAYAPDIEDGMRTARSGQVTGRTQQRLTLRSRVGGFHSVKLTVANADRLLAAVVARFRR